MVLRLAVNVGGLCIEAGAWIARLSQSREIMLKMFTLLDKASRADDQMATAGGRGRARLGT